MTNHTAWPPRAAAAAITRALYDIGLDPKKSVRVVINVFTSIASDIAGTSPEAEKWVEQTLWDTMELITAVGAQKASWPVGRAAIYDVANSYPTGPGWEIVEGDRVTVEGFMNLSWEVLERGVCTKHLESTPSHAALRLVNHPSRDSWICSMDAKLVGIRPDEPEE